MSSPNKSGLKKEKTEDTNKSVIKKEETEDTNKSGIKIEKIEIITSDNDSETSSNGSEFELAKDHFSDVHILEYDTFEHSLLNKNIQSDESNSKDSKTKKQSKVSSPVKVENGHETTTKSPKAKTKVNSPVKVKYEYETQTEYDDTSETDLNKNAQFEDDEESKRTKVKVKTKTGSCRCKKSIERVTSKPKQESTVSLPPNFRPKQEVLRTSDSQTQTNIVPEDPEQKHDVNVSPISAKFDTTGTIKIPIELQVSLRGSGHNIVVKQETTENPREKYETVSLQHRYPPIKCIYQQCSAWEYMEMYLDELLEEPSIGKRTRPNDELVFNGNWADHFFEPHLQAIYVPSRFEFNVPDGPEDLSAYFHDFDELRLKDYPHLVEEYTPPKVIKYREKKKQVVEDKVELIKDDSEISILLEDVYLPATGEVKIAPAEPEPEEKHKIYYIPPPPTSNHTSRNVAAETSTKKKKGGGLFGCCAGNDDDEDDVIPEPPIPPARILRPVPKISLVYDQHCLKNEPYTRALLNAYPHHEKSDSPCSSKTEIPWNELSLSPNTFKIRTVDLIPDLIEVKTESSISIGTISSTVSSPCVCSSKKRVVDVKPIVKKISGSSTLPAKNPVTFCDNKLVTLYPPTNLPAAPSKSNTFKPEVSKQKEPIGIIKTTLSGKSKSDHGIMRTKVTLSDKDLQRCKESQGRIKSSNVIIGSGHQKLETKPICSSTNEVKVSTSHSAPVLVKQENCKSVSCSANIKLESNTAASVKLESKPSSHIIKPDPVISALIACEAELKPVKQALNTVQQKLRNMNMPELDSIFSKGTQLANEFLNKAQQNRCPYANKYVPSYATTSTKPANMNYMNDRIKTYAPPITHYPATYTSPTPSCTYMQQRPRPYVEQCQCRSAPSSTYVQQRPRPYAEQYQFAPAPYYGPYSGSSPSQASSCASSMQNFSTWPNYDTNDRYLEDRSPSKSALKRPGYRNKHVRYQRDRSEDWRSRDRSEHNCRCSSSNYGSHNRINIKRSDDKMSYTSSSSPSEDSLPKTRSSRRRDRRLVPKKNKSKHSGTVSRQSLCPFLEAMKSIMILDKEKTVKKGSNGVSYDTKLSTKKIKNMKVSMRVRTSKKSKK